MTNLAEATADPLLELDAGGNIIPANVPPVPPEEILAAELEEAVGIDPQAVAVHEEP